MATKKKLTKAQVGIMTTPQDKSNSSGQATQYKSGVTPSSSTGDASKAGATGTYKKGGSIGTKKPKMAMGGTKKIVLKKPIKKAMYGTAMKPMKPTMMKMGGSTLKKAMYGTMMKPKIMIKGSTKKK